MIIVLAIYLVQRLWRFRSTPARLPLTAIPGPAIREPYR